MQQVVNHPLKSKHTFGIASTARQWCVVNNKSELPELASLVEGRPFWILGEGSNTVFCEDYSGVVVHIATKGVVHNQDSDFHYLSVASGENWHELVVWTLAHGIPGLENLALIPGSVGAAPIQNIGAYGKEICEFVDYVEVFDLSSNEFKLLKADECEFGYRDSVFKQPQARNWIISEVGLKLAKSWRGEVSYQGLALAPSASADEIFERVVEVRQQKLPDPAQVGNAGSFFKNPVVSASTYEKLQADYPLIPGYVLPDNQVKLPAAWLIDQVGGKSMMSGGAGVHPHQALVLINKRRASGGDLLALAGKIQREVLNRFDCLLVPEVRLLDASGEINLSEIA